MELESLIDEIDIVEYISQFVELEEKNGEYWGLSPFKDENTPSFSVRRETGDFYDFSSGIGGSVYTFVKHYNHCSRETAIDLLCQYVGCGDANFVPKKKMTAALVCKKYKPKNTKKKSANSVYPEDCMLKYEKRKDKLDVWRSEGISDSSLEKYGVYYDSFSDRLVYPIKNMSGQIVNIGGRTLDPNYKENGLRKYTYFSGWNGTMDVIYGLFENMESILAKHEVIIFEGCKSVLLADTWGIHNTAALLTSHLSPSQLKILAKLGCKVVFALDKEIRIRDDHNINKLKRYVKVEYLWDKDDLLNEKDAPVDKGLEVFQKLYDTRFRYR